MDLTPDPKAAKLLRDALDLINDEGRHWIKGNFTGDVADGVGFCSLGAIRQVVFGDVLIPFTPGDGVFARYDKMVRALTEAVGYEDSFLADPGRNTRNIGTGVVEWNDDPERTFPEVKAGFERAIAKLGG